MAISFLLSAFHALFQAWDSQFSEEADGCWWICDLPTTITQFYGALNHPKDKNKKQVLELVKTSLIKAANVLVRNCVSAMR